ncbi:MAG: hypothetical protein V3T77_07105, partial [Planctomycetota bacterium]
SDNDSDNVNGDNIDGGSVGAPADQWLEISFEQIDELRDFEGYAAIDLGTSNSMISLYHLHKDAVRGMPWSPELECDAVEIPSAVFVRDLARFRRLADHSCSVGRAALEEYRENPEHDPRSLQLSTKRLVGAGQILAADAQGVGGYVDPLNVLHMLARFIREGSQSHEAVKSRLRRIMVTFPPTWDYRQIDRWKEVFRRLGFGEEELDLSLDEASAAGLFYVHRWIKDADSRKRLIQDLLHSWSEIKEGKKKGDSYLLNLLSFDFGGGTVDLAFIRVQLTLLDGTIRLRVALKDSDSLNYGGDQVTLSIFKILKRRLAMALSDPERLAGDGAKEKEAQAAGQHASLESGLFLLPTTRYAGRRRMKGAAERGREILRRRWNDLEKTITSEHLPKELEEAVDAVFPTIFWRTEEEPLSPAAKRNFGWLWEQAENLKCEIFREASHRARKFSLRAGVTEEIRGGILLKDIPEELGRPRLQGALAEARAWVSIAEIYRCISEPLEQAVERARRLAGEEKVDRVVLTGQSSWIPLVRELFMRPRSEGGFGLPPTKIEFDEENAKAAVSKGACLLRVMRDALVGIDVDVSDFKANLLADIFYKSPMEGPCMLFRAGPIDDLSYVEDSPDPASFARHLALFYGTADCLLGQFDFGALGEELPEFRASAGITRRALEMEGTFPTHDALLQLKRKDPPASARIVSAMRDWPERAIIAWIEATAKPGTPERPMYRYYMTRNRNLIAIRDSGSSGKQLYTVQVDNSGEDPVARQNPYSGVH